MINYYKSLAIETSILFSKVLYIQSNLVNASIKVVLHKYFGYTFQLEAAFQSSNQYW
jgi:hypothetical protein